MILYWSLITLLPVLPWICLHPETQPSLPFHLTCLTPVYQNCCHKSPLYNLTWFSCTCQTVCAHSSCSSGHSSSSLSAMSLLWSRGPWRMFPEDQGRSWSPSVLPVALAVLKVVRETFLTLAETDTWGTSSASLVLRPSRGIFEYWLRIFLEYQRIEVKTFWWYRKFVYHKCYYKNMFKTSVLSIGLQLNTPTIVYFKVNAGIPKSPLLLMYNREAVALQVPYTGEQVPKK